MIDDLWYKNAIFYCLNVGTFMDANGDGVGDFEGLMRRLDYLAGLGVTALWLMRSGRRHAVTMGMIRRILWGRPALRDAGRLCRFYPACTGPRHSGHYRLNHQSHLGPAPLVPCGTPGPTVEVPRLLLLVQKKPAGADKGMVFPGAQKNTWTSTAKHAPTTITASTSFSPIST